MLKRWWPAAVVVVILCVVVGGRWYVEAVNQSHPAPWPMTGGGSGMRHYTSATFPATASPLWSLPVSKAEFTPPLIGKDGTVYIDAGTEVLAVDPDGKRRWAWKSSAAIWSMALSRYGTLYAMDPEDLQALDSNGRLQWRVKLPEAPISHLMVGQGGSLYYASATMVHALADNGSAKWSQEVGSVLAGPVESSGGLIVVATSQELVALRPGGEVEWSRSIDQPVPARPLSAGPDGRIYVRTRTATLVVDEKGAIKAETPVARISTNLAVGKEILQEGLVRRDALLKPMWTLAIEGRYRTIYTLLDGKGNLLLIEHGGMVRSVEGGFPSVQYRLWDPEGKVIWASGNIRPMTEPAVDAKGRLYFIGRLNDSSPLALICIGEK